MQAIRVDGTFMDGVVIDKSTGVGSGEGSPEAPGLGIRPDVNRARRTVSFSAALADAGSDAELTIIDAAGRALHRWTLPASEGNACLLWDCEDSNRRGVPAGVCFARLVQDGLTACCTVVLLGGQ